MKRTLLVLTLILAAVGLALVILYWNPIVVHLSQETGTSSGSSRAYQFWSGFGANFGEFALLGGIIAVVRHHNCHVKGCWRMKSHPVEGTPFVVCKKHHPAIPSDVTATVVAEAHAQANQ